QRVEEAEFRKDALDAVRVRRLGRAGDARGRPGHALGDAERLAVARPGGAPARCGRPEQGDTTEKSEDRCRKEGRTAHGRIPVVAASFQLAEERQVGNPRWGTGS